MCQCQMRKIVRVVMIVKVTKTLAHHVRVLVKKGSLSTDDCERPATGSWMFPFLVWSCSLPRTGKALVDDCGLTLQTRWRENAPKKEKFTLRLSSVAQKRLCLSSLIAIIIYPLSFNIYVSIN